MKKIVITGGGGFLGQRLVRELLRRNPLPNGRESRIVLVDVAAPQSELVDERVTLRIGDMADPQFVREILDKETDGVMHLAAVVSGAAEADFDLGMRVNLDGTRILLDACRRLPRPPRFLNGDQTECPVEPDTALWLISPRRAIDCLLYAFNLPSNAFGNRALNLPGITVSVREMIAALERAVGPEAVSRIEWRPDPTVRAIVNAWPAYFDTARAKSLSFPTEENGFDQFIADYLHERSSVGL